MLGPPEAHGQPQDQNGSLLHADTLSGAYGERWPFRLYSADKDEPTIVVEDPNGYSFQIPAMNLRLLHDAYVVYADEAGSHYLLAIPERNFPFVAGLTLVGLATALGLPLFLYRGRYRRERTRRRGLQKTARQLASSREDERIRIARDLHDGPLQDLHALHMHLGLVAMSLADAHKGSAVALDARRVRGAEDDAQTIIGELRRIAQDLRPPALGPFGLAAALQTLTDRFRRQHPEVDLDLDLDDDAQIFTEPTRNALYRIAQEAINNAVKHGSPSQIHIRLRIDGRQANLTVEDDGVGFEFPDIHALAASGHFGLLGMTERADAIGGRLAFGRGSMGGGRVRVNIANNDGSGRRRWLPVPTQGRAALPRRGGT